MAESPTAETSLIIGSKEEAPIRVLHVDDDAGFLETAQQILELQGSFQVETASSVDEAFELVKEKVYDVIVSDFQMPGKDGLQFLRKLRGAGNPTPFVMFTGRGREAVAIQALNLGADQYVNKTGDPATVYGELAHAIDHAVQTRRARERLRRSEASYRSLVEEAGAGILTVDPQGVFTYVNEELGNILGFSRRELLGKPFADFIHPDDKQRILQIFASFMKNPDVKPRFEFRAIHKRGYTLHLHSAPTRLTYEGEVVGSYAIVTDVTEREKAEKERDKLLRDYGARVKELRCLYEIANLVETPNISLEEILQGTSDLLPAAWRYPDVTCARIVFENHEFKTKNFRETKWKQQSDVNVHGKKAGAVEVYYLEDKPPAADGPFLIEERSLIDAVAERLGRIIERMKAQEAMAASRKRLDDILDAIPDSVCVTNLDGNITLANEAMTGLFGLSRDKFLTMKGRDLAAEEDQAQIFKAMQNVIQTGRPQDVQTTGRLGGAEGRSFWIRFSTLKNEKGEPAGFVTITRDVTEQKEREKNLKQSEEKYRDIVELAPDGIATVNMKGVVTSVNDCFLKLTGYSSDEIVGKRFTKLGTIRKRDMPRLLKLFTSMVRGKTPKPFEIAWQRKDGTLALAEVRATLLKEEGKIIGIQAIARDITERKYQQRRIEESQRKFEQLFKGNPEAAIYMDANSHVVDINPRFQQLFGYSLDEIRGKYINQVVVPEDLMEEAEELDKKALKGYTYYDTVRKTKGGALVPVSISAAPIITEGTHVGKVGVYKDISQLKRAEKTLKEALNKSAVLNEKLGVVGRLTRHDVRNKLSAITGNIYLATQKMPSREISEHLQAADSAVSQIVKILDFASVYEKLGVEELSTIDVGKAVDEAVSLFSDLSAVKVVNECHGLTVLADSLLRQLFYNLIHNSLVHGERVSQIGLSFDTTYKDAVKLVYEDNGVGIPKADKERVFEKGFGKGTGLGLFLIRRICAVYGWTIRETGKEGYGAKFTIAIPRDGSDGTLRYEISRQTRQLQAA